jgi:hypothetical protein
MRALRSRNLMAIVVGVALVLTFGCGSSSSSNSNSGGGGGTTNNVQPISMNGGPELEIEDGAFTSVTVCSPGSSTNCQTISGILIDTGSSGLRIMSSALSINLTQQTNGSGAPIVECAEFGSGTTWGPVQTADVKIAGEVASSMPIQVIGSASFPTVPGDCPGVTMDTVQDFGANGLLGIGQAVPDCGAACDSPSVTGAYYACPNTGCVDTAETVSDQVQNPVAGFGADSNGTIIELPAVSTPAATLSGSLIFGIGTQSNNGLGSATVFGTDDFGDFNIAYNSTTYPGFLDSGSNSIYFLDTATTGLPLCTNVNINYLYCPTSNQTIPIVITAQAGTNGASASASFVVGDANVLLSGNDAAVDDLAGPFSLTPVPSPLVIDLGSPFFFGRSVYTAIVGKSTPGGTGPYTAY